MTTLLIILRKLAIVLMAVSLLSACGGKEERKAKYLERGKSYLAEGNFDKARIEFKNVLQIDPKDAQGYLYLGQVEEGRQEWGKAFGAYKKAVELDAELVEPRIRLAKFYMAQATALNKPGDEGGKANALGLVQEEIKEIRAREAENLEAMTLEAMLWLNDGETDKAVKQLEAVVSSDPGLLSAVVPLSALYDQQDNPRRAEDLLLNAIEKSPKEIRFKQRLAAHYIGAGDNASAEAVLKELVEIEPDELSPRVALASFFSRTNQVDKAEAVLKATIAADPEDSQRYLLLTEFLSSTQGADKAIAALVDYSQQKPDMAELRLALAKLYYSNGETEKSRAELESVISSKGVEPAALEARVLLAKLLAAENTDDPRVSELVEEVLAENARDNEALLLKGKLAAAKRDYVEAIANFRSVLKDQPGDAEVLQLLAAAHIGNNERELALDTFQRGIENNPGDNDLRMSLAKLLAEGGDQDQAIEQLDTILKRDDKYMPALVAKYDSFSVKGDAGGMLEVVEQMEVAAPDDESVAIRKARVYYAQQKFDDTLGLLDSVLKKNPDSVPALLAKAEVLSAQKRYEDALPVVTEIIRIQPESAEGYYRKAKLFIAINDYEAAAKQLDIAIDKAPNSRQLLKDYVQLRISQGNQKAAKQRIQALLAKNPDHASANLMLGLIAVSEKDYAAADAAFSNQVKAHPEDIEAHASLARGRVASGDLRGAEEAFKSGLAVHPDNVRLLIGLAGVQERQSAYDAAIASYEKVLVAQPDNAVSTNNLAALLSDHRTDEESLARALELSEKLEKTQQPAFLDTAGWVYYRARQYGKAEEILKGVVESAPKVPVFQYHLGMVYSKLGDKESARKHLTLATDGEVSYQGLEEARATLEAL